MKTKSRYVCLVYPADTDETLQRKTLDLLYRMTNPVNVEFISEKLIEFLSGTTDLFLKRVLTTRVCTIAERYAPNNAWYIRTITKLFEVSGDMVSQEVAQNLMSLIAEGTGESEEADMLLRQNAVEIYVGLLQEKPVASLPRILLETMAWCLGEYGYLSAVSSLDDVLSQICNLAKTHKAKLAPTTRRFLVSAIMKLVAQAGTCPPHAAAVIDDYTRSRDVDLQQRCLEFQNLLTNCPNLLPEILPVDASAEDVEVDENLSFLDGYVQTALANGSRPYNKPEDDDDDDDYGAGDNGGQASAFKMTPYEKPQAPSHAMLSMAGVGSAGRSGTAGVSLPPGAQNSSGSPMPAHSQSSVPGGLSLNTSNVANVWGRSGLKAEAASPKTPPAPASGPPSSTWDNQAAAGGISHSSSFGASGDTPSYGAPAPAPEPVKTAEQLEKERLAAGLFGGIVPGAPPPPPTQASAPVSAPPPPRPPASVPPPAPAPAPAVDLLDLGAWDDTPATPSPAPAFDNVDVLAPNPTEPPSAAAPVVETVSDDDADAAVPESAEAVDEDPFAGAGLLNDVQDKPLTSFSLTSSQKFEFNGSAMAPLQITTPQFGQQWGSCPATSPLSASSTKVTNLTQFMDLCANVGAHKVEAITATSEGICAGMLSAGSQIVLIHGKITPLASGGAKIDATVKGTDQAMCGSLAMYLQTLLR